MEQLDLVHRLLYLDRDYIADAYEAITGTPAQTQITKTEAKKAGAGIPVFSAEVSAGETRAFSASSTAMLGKVMPRLRGLPNLVLREDEPLHQSSVGWVSGDMSVFMVNLRRREHGESSEKIVASEKYFGLHSPTGMKLALLTTPEYFSSGLASFVRLYETVLGPHQLRVQALVRAYPASTDFRENIVVPLVIIEPSRDA